MTAGRRYALISPCRDEEKYMARTLDSVMRQTVPPSLWIVVDDGSSDSTPDILESYKDKIPYLKVVRRDNRGFRKVGGGVVDAFNEGLSYLDMDDFDYVCKFDMDLDLPAGYFEGLMRKLERDPEMGTCSGKPYFTDEESGAKVSENCGDEMSVGMTKFYRVDCFKDIGGFVTEVGWDIIDCHRCRMLGWRALAYNDEDLAFEHLRPMGSSYKSIWHGRVRHGFGQHFLGTHPLFMLASVVYRLNKAPIVIGALGMLWGYVLSGLQGKPRYPDLAFRKYLRSYQLRSLLVGKVRAGEEVLERVRRHGRLAEPAGGVPMSQAAVREP